MAGEDTGRPTQCAAQSAVTGPIRLALLLSPGSRVPARDNSNYRSKARECARRHANQAPPVGVGGGTLTRWPPPSYDTKAPTALDAPTTATGPDSSPGAKTTAVVRCRPLRRWWPTTSETPPQHATPTAHPSTRRPHCGDGQ